MAGGNGNHATRGFVLDYYMGTGTMSSAVESRCHGAGRKGNLCTEAGPPDSVGLAASRATRLEISHDVMGNLRSPLGESL